MSLRAYVALSGTCDGLWVHEATRDNVRVTVQSRESQTWSRLTHTAVWVWSLKWIVSRTAPWFIFISDETSWVAAKESGSKATLTQGGLWGTRTLLWTGAKQLSNSVNTPSKTLLAFSGSPGALEQYEVRKGATSAKLSSPFQPVPQLLWQLPRSRVFAMEMDNFSP